jgi:protein gp37
MEKTNIIWTEKTWNPVTGCQRISAGCKFCYAETIAERYKGHAAFPNGFELTYREHKLNDPYSWKENSFIFVNSMSDFFWDKISDEYRDKMLFVMSDTPNHEYQLLTKRTGKAVEYFKTRDVPRNVWIGATVENQKSKYRIDDLRKINVSLRFLSVEPLLEDLGELDLSGIHWVITGGESGNHLGKNPERSMVERIGKNLSPKIECVRWVDSIRIQSENQNVSFFHKQWGGNYPEAAGRLLNGKTYNGMPRYPKGKESINNQYLINLEKELANKKVLVK